MALNSRNTASVNSAFSSNAADPPLPPPPQLTIRSPSPAADIPSSPSIVSSPVPHDIPSEEAEYALDEATLRDIYADEEIDRFLHLFNAYVTEVHDPSLASDPNSSYPESWEAASVRESVDGGENDLPNAVEGQQGLSRRIALRLVPHLLPPQPLPPAFTIGRLRQSAQRLYLAIEPTYGPFFKASFALASWQDPKRSLIYCSGFWILWWHNLLLPALFLRLIYALLRRRFLPYPSLKELQAHRAQLARATEFGKQLHNRLSATSTLGVKDAWRLFKLLNKDKKRKVKETAEYIGCDNPTASPADADTSTVVDDQTESKEERDLKRLLLTIMNEIADLHERFKNLFRWRHPVSSRIYGCVLLLLFGVTFTLSAQVLAKLVYFVLGLFFWHITPIILALTPEEARRLPPAFGDLPTDADYAMELISQRVAAGLDVRTSTPRHDQRLYEETSRSASNVSLPESSTSSIRSRSLAPPPLPPRRGSKDGPDWAKWGQRAATGIQFANDTKKFLSKNGSKTSQVSSCSTTATAALPRRDAPRPQEAVTHSFPAQHTSMPGLITLTATHFYFTSLVSTEARISYPLAQVKGVKKVGILNIKGMNIVLSEDGVEKEEKFRWVGGRDELFARLVALGSSRWVRS